MTRFATVLAGLALLAASGPAFAQQAQAPAAAVSPGRCGGVLCDLYYRDVPAGAPIPPSMTAMTTLPCHDFLCAMFGGRTPDQPAVEQAALAPEPAAETVKPAKRKKHIARAKAAEVKAADATSVAAPAASAAK